MDISLPWSTTQVRAHQRQFTQKYHPSHLTHLSKPHFTSPPPTHVFIYNTGGQGIVITKQGVVITKQEWLSYHVFLSKTMHFYKTGQRVAFVNTRTETCIKGRDWTCHHQILAGHYKGSLDPWHNKSVTECLKTVIVAVYDENLYRHVSRVTIWNCDVQHHLRHKSNRTMTLRYRHYLARLAPARLQATWWICDTWMVGPYLSGSCWAYFGFWTGPTYSVSRTLAHFNFRNGPVSWITKVEAGQHLGPFQ
jgi:hypothetical protein